MCFGTRNRWGTEHRIKDLFCLMLCIVLLSAAVACSTHRRVIKNESLDDWDGRRMRYKNLFPFNFIPGQGRCGIYIPTHTHYHFHPASR